MPEKLRVNWKYEVKEGTRKGITQPVIVGAMFAQKRETKKSDEISVWVACNEQVYHLNLGAFEEEVEEGSEEEVKKTVDIIARSIAKEAEKEASKAAEMKEGEETPRTPRQKRKHDSDDEDFEFEKEKPPAKIPKIEAGKIRRRRTARRTTTATPSAASTSTSLSDIPFDQLAHFKQLLQPAVISVPTPAPAPLPTSFSTAAPILSIDSFFALQQRIQQMNPPQPPQPAPGTVITLELLSQLKNIFQPPSYLPGPAPVVSAPAQVVAPPMATFTFQQLQDMQGLFGRRPPPFDPQWTQTHEGCPPVPHQHILDHSGSARSSSSSSSGSNP
jgi:hypothetical protein